MTKPDVFLCEVDESASLREQVHQTTMFGEVEAATPPPSILVYCGDRLVRASKVDDGYLCPCGHVIDGVVW